MPPSPNRILRNRAIASLREVLRLHGYPTSAALRLFREGMGETELAIRCREPAGAPTSLVATHGIAKVAP